MTNNHPASRSIEGMDEMDAIRRLSIGDIAGLEVLVRKYQVKAIRAAYLITQDNALAEDIVQEAFIRVYHRIEQYDTARPFAPWFMQIVANDAVKAVQRYHRQVSLDADVSHDNDLTFMELLADSLPTPAEEAEQHELKHIVMKALAQLSPSQRKAVVMRYYLDMSEREMSDELNVPPGTVKWRLSAARKVLRGILPRTFTEKVVIGKIG